MTDITHKHLERIVKVELGPRSYDIIIGPGMISSTGEWIQRIAPGARCAVITDEHVARTHLHSLALSLMSTGVTFTDIVLPPGEGTKNFSHLIDLCDTLLDDEFERGDVIIAFGGGVVGDLAGFAASIFKRGVKLVQIPTTLLAQVDSSVGGKTGINTRHGKNLIGTFYQPSLVIIDTMFPSALPERDFRAGYAEVVKYGMMGDAAFFEWLEQNGSGIFSGAGAARIHAIEQACKTKAAIVSADEREAGQRQLLNLGHTFGHALEAWAGLSGRLRHGEGVAIGMVLAAQLSEEMGLCPKGVADRLTAHLKTVGLPTSIADLAAMSVGKAPSVHELMSIMVQDKKVKGGHVTFILLRGIGEAFISDDVEPDALEAFLEARCRT